MLESCPHATKNEDELEGHSTPGVTSTLEISVLRTFQALP